MTTYALPRPAGLHGAVAAAALICAVALLPWTAYLAGNLPAVHTTTTWSSAWVGFDMGLVVALGSTGILGLRRHPLFGAAAAVAATLLAADAWFDVMTSAGTERWVALALALLVELPLTALLLRAAVEQSGTRPSAQVEPPALRGVRRDERVDE